MMIVILLTGDFEEIYGETEELELEDGAPSAGHWDAVVTCFFIDTVIILDFPRRLRIDLTVRSGQKCGQLPTNYPPNPRSRWSVD